MCFFMILIARIITIELDDTINYMRVRYVLRFYEQVYICLFVLSMSVNKSQYANQNHRIDR